MNPFDNLSNDIFLCGTFDTKPCYCKVNVPSLGKGEIIFESISSSSQLTGKDVNSTIITLQKEDGQPISHKRINRNVAYYYSRMSEPTSLIPQNFLSFTKVTLKDGKFESNTNYGTLFSIKNEFYVYSYIDDIYPVAYLTPRKLDKLNYPQCTYIVANENMFVALDKLVDEAKNVADSELGIQKSDAVTFAANSLKTQFPDYVNISKTLYYFAQGVNLRSKYDLKPHLDIIDPYLLQFIKAYSLDSNKAAEIYLDQAIYIQDFNNINLNKENITKSISAVEKAGILIKNNNVLLAKQLYYLGEYSMMLGKLEINSDVKIEYYKSAITACKKSISLNVAEWNAQSKACLINACNLNDARISSLCP